MKSACIPFPLKSLLHTLEEEVTCFFVFESRSSPICQSKIAGFGDFAILPTIYRQRNEGERSSMRGGLILFIGGLVVIFGPVVILPPSFHFEQHPTISNAYTVLFIVSIVLSLIGLVVVITISTIRFADLLEKSKRYRQTRQNPPQ
jgi:uncharacterized membrane protein